jgi:hypothetical protein
VQQKRTGGAEEEAREGNEQLAAVCVGESSCRTIAAVVFLAVTTSVAYAESLMLAAEAGPDYRELAMRISLSIPAGTASLLLLPGVAYAQYVPIWLVAAALSPVVVVLFAIILGALSRSWRIGALHTGLVFAWIVLFGLAAYFIENDYVIWTPLVLYAAHAILILILIVVNIARRFGNADRAA